ncbi:membrane protein [Streptococcus sp. VT 162]|nr:membrane protein [Streptococcus sp. VT 162]
MRKNILLVFICSFFLFPILVKANPVSDYLPNNNFNIIEFDKNTNKPKLKESSESTKELLDNAKKAKEKEAEIKKQNESKSKLTYENYKSRMSDLTSKAYFDKKFFGFDSNINYFFNSLVQAVFWVGKLVFYVIAELYSAVESMSDVSSLLNEAVKNSSKVFSSLFSQEIIYMVGASMAAYLLYIFATGKGSFFKTLIKMLLIYTCIGVYFIQFPVNGQNKYLLTHVYDAFRTTTITLNGEITKTLTGESKDGVETYFSETLLKGYKYMNSPVNDKGEFVLSEKEFEDLAGYKQGDGDHLVGEKKIKDIAKDKDPENKMLKNEWGLKFMYAFASDVDIIVMGTIYLLLGLSRFFFLIVFILLIVLLPFILLLSLFPKMEHLLIGFNKKAISMLALSSIMLLATTLFSFFYNTLTSFVSTAVGGDLLVTVFLKALLLFLMWKYRHSLLTAFSRVTNSPVGKIGREISNSQAVKNLKERIAGTGKLGLKSGKDGLKVGGQFAKGGLKLGKDKLSENLKTLRKDSPLVDKVAEKGEAVKNRMDSIRERKNSSVNALKEKGSKALAKLYGVRANAFREGSDDRKLLKGKQKLRDEEAKKYAGQKNASREAVRRLKEERARKREQRFKEEQQRSAKQKMQTTKTTNPRAVGRRKSDVNSARNDVKSSKQYRSKKEKRLKAKRRKVDI